MTQRFTPLDHYLSPVPPAIEIQGLTRHYVTQVGVLKKKTKVIEALKGIDLQVGRGQILGLLGPNGAGKTTLIKTLCTLLLPSSGQARILGLDIDRQATEVRQHINFVFGGDRGMYWRLSAEDNLRFFANLYNVSPAIANTRIPELLSLVGLKGRENERIEGFSKGMRQRLAIAKCLINDPDVILLDEPTLGLDPMTARALRDIIISLKQAGKTILITTHYTHEAEYISDDIVIINKGRIIAQGDPATLRSQVRGREAVEWALPNGLSTTAVNEVRSLPSVHSLQTSDFGGSLTLRALTDDVETLIATVVSLEPTADPTRLFRRPPNLEDAYIALIQHSETV